GFGTVAAYVADNVAVDLGGGTASINGSGATDTLIGITTAMALGSNDTLIGAFRTTTLIGAAAWNTLIGGGGRTTLLGQGLGDVLIGGSGQTVAAYTHDNVSIDLGAGTAGVNGASTTDTLVGLTLGAVSGAHDTITADNGYDTLTATGSHDTL